jgi:CDP-glycerol glycerophosphotransferase (TagB/SpsB family)
VKIASSKFLIVGRPQTAGLRPAEQPIGRIHPPTVLYAPTWRGYNAQTALSSLPVGSVIVRALLQRGAVVSFRPHPFSWLGARERSEISAIDELLRRDRDGSGRPHRTAADHRHSPVAEEIDASDALITDIGSVLIDYFATGKPYAVVLPPGKAPETARTELPSTAAAYLISYDALRQGAGEAPRPVLDQLLDELLETDPLAVQRPGVARYYLGDQPGDDRPFLAAVHDIIGDPQPARWTNR